MHALVRAFVASLLAISLQPGTARATRPARGATTTLTANTLATPDGVQPYYEGWGPKDGPVATLSHGWPLDSDRWESRIMSSPKAWATSVPAGPVMRSRLHPR
jgi:non-heme chloroperoxidase